VREAGGGVTVTCRRRLGVLRIPSPKWPTLWQRCGSNSTNLRSCQREATHTHYLCGEKWTNHIASFSPGP